ncbi:PHOSPHATIDYLINOSITOL GLYCAN, putative [Babesia bigemina]|uniref:PHOSPHATIDYLINOSITOL GLYCAN, putative n=1 Tax=Babesia bigemina TaxID=5866 RepID=A0A061D230_BABBI|nr:PHOSPHATIDYLINOSITOL GLYCAN, putative [Babesia bigemina]CDR94683.1 PHOSPHATIDYLINOSITOL GLYCAN, putative [Babesia bigemina]|eukprot:XP_012766869.1 PHOSPHATIDYLINOSITOL GLYCAN, putative [Babesia bigemina]
MEPRPRWKRITYKRQPYPANYVSDDFLRGLSENVCNNYTLKDVCPKTMMLTQHCSTMLIMGHMFMLVKDDAIPLQYVEVAAMLVNLLFCALMYAASRTKIGEWHASPDIMQSDRFRHVIFAFVVQLALQLLQPVFQTLTSSFSYDTVYEDYVRDVDALPMNCLILVAILVSSRFGCPQKVSHSQTDVTRRRTFSVLPLLQRFLMESKSVPVIYGSTAAVVLATCSCLYACHPALVPVYILGRAATYPGDGIQTRSPKIGNTIARSPRKDQ